jgi:hypothetical protein
MTRSRDDDAVPNMLHQPKEPNMTLREVLAHPRFLQRLLRADAFATGATAALLLAGADALAPVLNLPPELQRVAGLICVPFVAWIALLSRRGEVRRGVMATVVAINFAWVAASLWVAFGGTWQPNAAGIAFVLAQALAVLGFAEFGWMGLRAARRPAFA